MPDQSNRNSFSADELPRTPRCPECGLLKLEGHVCGPSVAEVRGRKVSYLNTVDFARLNQACVIVTESLGHCPYLVGSSTDKADFRDVDVRSILPDAQWDDMFKGREFFWSLFCLGVSAYLSQQSGLPVDYQCQRMTEANEKHTGSGKSRNPIGTKGRPFAGGGDAVPDWVAKLPDSPEDYLTDEDKAAFAEWAERNRLRKARISMETGIGHVG